MATLAIGFSRLTSLVIHVEQNLLSIPNPSGSVSAPTGGSSHNGTGTSSLRRRLGKLGIPIDDDDDGDIGIDTEDERLMLEYQLAQDEEFGRASLTGLGSLKASDRGPSESDTESIAGNAPASLGKPNNIQTRQDASLAGARAAVDDDRVAQPGGLQRHPTGPTSWTEQSFRDIVSNHQLSDAQAILTIAGWFSFRLTTYPVKVSVTVSTGRHGSSQLTLVICRSTAQRQTSSI